VRCLFPQVLELLKLLLVCPVTSCECERSFSALRRLKTSKKRKALRSTMAQQRLNHISFCHVHKEHLDGVNVVELAKSFVQVSEIHRKVFGTFI
jgi:hypothetical protein